MAEKPEMGRGCRGRKKKKRKAGLSMILFRVILSSLTTFYEIGEKMLNTLYIIKDYHKNKIHFPSNLLLWITFSYC